MLTIAVIDDGVGAFPTLSKLRQVISANYICILTDKLSKLSPKQLSDVGKRAVAFADSMGCDVTVVSSVALSRCCKALSAVSQAALYGCDAPIVHASTYTASNVLLACDRPVPVQAPNLVQCVMPDFPALAERLNDRDIVRYIEDCCERYYGTFDCIALACSSMNLYKHCFARVFPNVQIFDSLEGVARRLRKKYKKFSKEEGSVRVVTSDGADVTCNYAYFVD